MTLRGRLLLSFAYLLTVAVAALAVPLGITIDRRARADFETRLAGEVQVLASTLGGSPRPGGSLAALRATVARFGSQTDARLVVVDARGVLVADSEQPSPPRELYATASRPEIERALRGQNARFVRHSQDLGTDLLVLAYPVLDGRTVTGAVRASEPVGQVDARVRRSWLVLVAVGAVVLLAGAAAAWALASSLARPLRGLAQTAGRLGAGDLSARAPERGPRDVAEVARALNHTAAALEDLLAAQREFVANASHQLRTPLTGLRLRLEALADSDGADAAEAAAAIREVDRLNALVGDLLVLARAGTPAPVEAVVALAAGLEDAAERWSAAAEERAQSLSVAPPSGEVRVRVDPGDLAVVLDNLIENAIVYCPPGSNIRLEGAGEGGEAWLAVEDDGPGIAPDETAHVFERFYRGRTGKGVAGGTGLGLAIVRETAQRFGGGVSIERPEQGTRIVVRFPAERLVEPTVTVS